MHAVAIRLRDEGFDDHVVAVALEIEDVEVPVLLQIADRKLDNVMALGGSEISRTDGSDRPLAQPSRHSRDQGEPS